MNIITKKYPKLMSPEERFGEIIIEDIPVLFGKNGEIICIPKRAEIPSPIGCVAKKGKGKTLLIHKITEEAFWNWGINCAIMNDSLEECYDWCKPQDNKVWINQLSLIGEIPISLPIVYVYPHTSTLGLDEEKTGNWVKIKDKDIAYVKIALPFEEVINNIENWLPNLGGSGPHLKKLKEELVECETVEDVYGLIDGIDVGDASTAVRNKIKTRFDVYFNEEILKISNPEIPADIKVKDYFGNPFVALMNLEVVPCFITSDLYRKPYKDSIWAYHINAIFEAQRGIFKGKKTYLAFDELTRVCSTGKKGDNLATDALNDIASRGRMKDIGLIYATQNYERIPPIIRSNTEYLFVLRHSSRREVNEIAKDFDLTGYEIDEILNLEKLECLAVTSEYFRVYYLNGEVKDEKGPLRGKIIPPMSRHKVPRK